MLYLLNPILQSRRQRERGEEPARQGCPAAALVTALLIQLLLRLPVPDSGPDPRIHAAGANERAANSVKAGDAEDCGPDGRKTLRNRAGQRGAPLRRSAAARARLSRIVNSKSKSRRQRRRGPSPRAEPSVCA